MPSLVFLAVAVLSRSVAFSSRRIWPTTTRLGGAASDVSFDEAQTLGANLLDCFVKKNVDGTPVPDDTRESLTQLLSTTSGARGYFVMLLTDDEFAPLFAASKFDSMLLEPLEANPEISVQLMTMNVAMSTSMAVYHARNGDAQLAAASTLTSERSVAIVEALMDRGLTPTLRPALRDLLNTAAADGYDDDGDGNDGSTPEWSAFLDRWGYDSTQRVAIAGKLARILNNIRS